MIGSPVIHAAVVLVNFVVHGFILGLQLLGARLSRKPLARRSVGGEEPFISIHVPAHNEPPELLKETLLSLSRLKWSNYEVLVIDNNTSDESLWKPVEAFCRELGEKFKFHHVENLPGFKAGAMNYVRQFMDPKAEFIFVVDADYVVERRALRRAIRYFTDPKIGLIQFPQDYRNTGPGNIGIALDFKHFFSGYMTMANTLQCVPSTGTLSLIRVAALRDVGGFSTESITEDADIGFRLNVRGYKCIFVNESIGKGVLPHDLEGLKKQRWRWAFGNAQILKLNWRKILGGKQLSWRQKLGFVTHLTAWFNFNLVPSISLIALGVKSLFFALTPLDHASVAISATTLVTYLIVRFATIYLSLRHDGHSIKEILLAYLTHLGLGWVFGASWIKCIWDHRAPFVRTNKFIHDNMPGIIRHAMMEIVMGLAMVVASIALILGDLIFGPLAALLICSGRLLIFWVAHQIKATWRLSQAALGKAPLPVKFERGEAFAPILQQSMRSPAGAFGVRTEAERIAA